MIILEVHFEVFAKVVFLGFDGSETAYDKAALHEPAAGHYRLVDNFLQEESGARPGIDVPRQPHRIGDASRRPIFGRAAAITDANDLRALHSPRRQSAHAPNPTRSRINVRANANGMAAR